MSLSTPGLLPAEGTQVVVQLTAPRECIWSAQTSATWVGIEPATGQGVASLTLTASANPQGRNRSATILINDQPFTVAQAGAPCTFQVAPSSVSVEHQGARVSLQLTTLDGCVWTTQSSHPWVRVVTGSSGDTSASLEVAVDSNTGPERSALLSVATVLVAINQNAAPNDRSACRFSLDPGSLTIPGAGGTGSFTVSTAATCAWSPSADQAWITVVSPSNPFGSNAVVYRVDPNPTTSVRSGSITAGTRRHVVRQEAARP